MNAHTPGPWYLDAHDEKGWFLLSESGPDIMAEPFDCADADARLIAAAPDLLEACESFLQMFKTGSNCDKRNPYTRPEVKAAIAAIAKVKGGEK
jgi:hypothetical protein